MKLLKRVALLGVIGSCFLLEFGCALSHKKIEKFYVAEDDAYNQWCLYRDEAEWRKSVDSAGAMVVGALLFKNGGLAKIDLTETDETGDWTVYDEYYLDNNKITKIHRTINLSSNNITVSQVYSVINGDVKKDSEGMRDLRTGNPLSLDSSAWTPGIELKKNLSEFPFKYFFRIEKNMASKECVKGPLNKPAPVTAVNG